MKVLQKQLAMAMQEMIQNTGSPLVKTVQTLRQIINFAIAMCPNGGKEQLKDLRNEFSTLILNEYQSSFEDPECLLSNEELIFRVKLEDIYGDASIVINDQKLVPASMMGFEKLGRPSQENQVDEDEVF